MKTILVIGAGRSAATMIKYLLDNAENQDWMVHVVDTDISSAKEKGYEKIVNDIGGNISNTVNKKTDFLVIGDKPGSKLQKAEKLNIKIISEDEFMKMT